jgi:hypothetical protein
MKKSPFSLQNSIHLNNYGTKYFNQHSKWKKKVEPEYQFKESSEPTGESSKKKSIWEKYHWTDYDMSIYYDNNTSSTAATYSFNTPTGGSSYYYQPIYWGEYKKQIGEEPVPSIPDSEDKTFNQFQEEFQNESQILTQLAKKQALKIKQEYQHEVHEFQKAQEIEQQKADMPIYSIEFAAARAFLQYYAHMALQKPPPVLKPEQILSCSKYLAATISCELRHRKRKCHAFWSRSLYMWDMLDDWSIDDHCSRRDAGKRFLSATEEWDGFMVEQYLKLGAYIFGGQWEGGFGGWPWASVAWYAGDWVYTAWANKGSIPVILWEKMLNAAHNNGRWMNKLGMGNVMGVLNMGANADPNFIADIAKKALMCTDPNDFKRCIEKWTHCELPGEKCKLELPNPGIIVEVDRYRHSKKTYLQAIKKLEEEQKAKAEESKLTLEAPDLAPIELESKKEEAVEVKHDGTKSNPMAAKMAESKESTMKTLLSALASTGPVMPSISPGPAKSPLIIKGTKLPWKGVDAHMKPPGTYADVLNGFIDSFAAQLIPTLSAGSKLPEPSPHDEVMKKKWEEIKGKVAPKHNEDSIPKGEGQFTMAEIVAGKSHRASEGGAHEQQVATG